MNKQNHEDTARMDWLAQCTAGAWESLNNLRLAPGKRTLRGMVDVMRKADPAEGQLTASIDVPVFHTKTGKPTCCANLTEGKVCPLLTTQRMGTTWACALRPVTPLQQEAGYLVPHKHCRLHQSTTTP